MSKGAQQHSGIVEELIDASDEPTLEETEIRSLARKMVHQELTSAAEPSRSQKFSNRQWRVANSNFE
jgi:hypothetical protein